MDPQDTVHLVLAADDGYARALAAAGRSAVATLSPDRRLCIHVLDVGISQANRAAVVRSLAGDRVEVAWVEGVRERVADLPSIWWFTQAIHARLLIPDLLTREVERAVYLDCDVIVERDLGELFDTAMADDAAVMAVPDVQAPLVGSYAGVPLWHERGLPPGRWNFNSGVMLMDLDVWRRDGIGEAAVACMRAAPEGVVVLDQHALNIAASGRIGALDPRWNQQAELFWDSGYDQSLPYSREQVEDVRHDPWIVHFSNKVKPWHNGDPHPLAARWTYYLDQTAYAGWRPAPRPLAVRALRLPARKAQGLARRFDLL